MSDTAPFSGLRVLDLGTRIAAPFCAGILGEQGAEVIKVEQPGTGDFTRSIGPFTDEGYSLFWAVEGRGRKSVTCDLSHPRGQRLFIRLAATADVIVENFRPGTLERWGLGPAALDPRIVFVRISAFGQDGPYANRPGLDRVGIAVGGLLHITGFPDRPPVRPGVTLSDYLTGAFAAEAAAAALYERDAGGSGLGRVIDAPLYGSVLRVLEWTVAAYDRLGIVREREGNRLSNSAPLDNYEAADGGVVCIVAGADANFERLAAAMGRPDLLTDERFTTLAERARHGDEINSIVAEWVGQHTASEVERVCLAHHVPVARAYTAADIAADPHLEIRGDLVTVDDPVAGPVRQQAPYPRLGPEPPAAPVGAPHLGEHNTEIWQDELGVSAAELAELEAAGVV